MAATGSFNGTFVGSWTATKIDITSGIGTVAQLVTDINDTDVIETVAAVTTIKPNGAAVQPRELEISAGVTLNHQVDGHTLGWNWGVTTTTYTVLDVASGGTFNVGDGTTGGDDCVLDFALNRQTVRAYIYKYGSFNVKGTLGHECILKHYRTVYWRNNGYDSEWRHWKLQSDITYTSGYGLSMGGDYSSTDNNANSFTNGKIECTNVTEAGYGMLWTETPSLLNTTFDNITFENHVHWIINGTYKMSNCTIKDMASSSPRIYGGGKQHGGVYETSKTEPFSKAMGQPKVVFDTCTFDNNYDDATNNYGFYAVDRGAIAVFKDCTFINSYYGCRVAHGGIAIWTGTNSITATVDRLWSTDGTHLHGHYLTLTVKDADGVAIENAICYLREKSTRDYFSIKTNASGEAKDIWGDDCILIEKEEVSTGSYVDWDNYELIVSATGYTANTSDIDPSGDIVKNVTLDVNPVATTIYDSTIYDSTIY